MNRRKAILGITFLSGTAFIGYKVFDLLVERNINLEDHKTLIAELADTIIPRTDTPSAKDAKVEEVILVLLKDCTERRTVNNFIDGLEDVEAYAKSNFQKSFIQCNVQQRNQILTHFENKGKLSEGFIGKVQKKIFGKPFFTTIKEYTVRGYCTSLKGANQGLAYVFIPGKRISCMDLTHNQKSWVTQ